MGLFVRIMVIILFCFNFRLSVEWVILFVWVFFLLYENEDFLIISMVFFGFFFIVFWKWLMGSFFFLILDNIGNMEEIIIV